MGLSYTIGFICEFFLTTKFKSQAASVETVDVITCALVVLMVPEGDRTYYTDDFACFFTLKDNLLTI